VSRLVPLIHELLAHSDAPTLQLPPNGLAVRPVALPDDGQAHPVAVQPDNLIVGGLLVQMRTSHARRPEPGS
jgi:hypothetical protein